VDSVELGEFLGSTGRSVVALGPILDKKAGWLRFGAYSYGAEPGATGDGVLATVVLRGRAGQALAELSELRMTDTRGRIAP